MTVLGLWGVLTHRESGGCNAILSPGEHFPRDFILPTIIEDSPSFEACWFTVGESPYLRENSVIIH